MPGLLLAASASAGPILSAGQSLTDNFTTPINQDPYFTFLSGTGPDWSVSSGSGQLNIGVTPFGASDLSTSSWNPGPHVIANDVLTGDFQASVNFDIGNLTSGLAYFTVYTQGGAVGLGLSQGIVSSASNSFGLNYSAPPITTGTLQLTRVGDTVTAAYEAIGANQFTNFYSVSDPTLALGTTAFGLAMDVANQHPYPTSVIFSDFTVTSADSASTVPDGGTTAAMLGVGMIGLAALRRRFAKHVP
jgi:hypothetical protein